MGIYTEKEVTELTAVTTPALTDVVAVRQSGDSVDKKATLTQVLSLGGGGGFYDAIVIVSDRKADGTDGGTATLGSWTTRDINSEDTDSAGICSISANQITLEAGTYDVIIRGQFIRTNGSRLRLYDTTGAAELAISSNAYTANGDLVSSDCWIIDTITLAVQSVLEVQYYTSQTNATLGLGRNDLVTIGVEIFTQAKLMRRA